MSQFTSWIQDLSTRNLISVVQEERQSISFTILSGDCTPDEYKYLCGKLEGLKALEDYIDKVKREDR